MICFQIACLQIKLWYVEKNHIEFTAQGPLSQNDWKKNDFFFYTLLFYSALHFLVSGCLLSPLSVSFRHTGHSKRVYDLVNMPPRKQSLALLLLLFFLVWDTCGILWGSLLCRTTLVLPISFLHHCLSPGCERKLRVSLFRYVRWQNENLNRV